MTRPQNILILCSDQHRRDAMGVAGDPCVSTPNLDALAASGTRFSRAYCNAPICVPSRASLATGLPIHEIPSWDNADPYVGQRRSFMHRARDAGLETTSIGKLHFRATEDDTGFDHEILPMHVVNGTGTFYSLLRAPVPRITAGRATLESAGAGETEYTAYDTAITETAANWLTARAPSQPFLLNVSFVNPHPPYQAPRALYEKYWAMDLPQPTPEDWVEHPAFDGVRQYFDTQEPLPQQRHRAVIAAYYANIEFLDQNIGRVLAALRNGGHWDDTLVLYFSDHGDTMGDGGTYGKCTLLEGAVAVPMILSGPGVPIGETCDTAVQLLDVYPTVLAALNLVPNAQDRLRQGRALQDIAAQASEELGTTNAEPDRWVLIQDHCAGATSAGFALTNGRLKYIHHLDFPPQLFDLDNDPRERACLAADPAWQTTLAALRDRLFDWVDPAAIDAACRASQAQRIAQQGGFDAIMAPKARTAYTPAPKGAPT